MKVLLIDDEPGIRLTLRDALADAGHEVTTCQAIAHARKALEGPVFDCIITDLRLPDGSGMDLLPIAQSRSKDTALLVITAHQTIETAIQATKIGRRLPDQAVPE